MADSSEDSFSEDFVFYRDREDWKDITPVPQDEGPHPIVRIAYSDRCKWIFFCPGYRVKYAVPACLVTVFSKPIDDCM